MSSKNAYEIRLEIFKEANNILWNVYHNQLESARLSAVAGGDQSGDYFNCAKVPTPEDIIACAEKLYKFVSNE